jgi:hypothetical protein
MPETYGNEKPQKHVKKTRQGLGRGTKWGNKNSKKYYKKKPRGQGGKRKY